MADYELTVKGAANATLAPGDSLDLAEGGVLVWLKDEDAAAWRLQQAKRQRETQQVIAFVQRKRGRR